MPYENIFSSALESLYPRKEPPAEALKALFGFGPAQAFDLLRNIKMFPAEVSAAEEALRKSKIANQMAELGIPQRGAEVAAFLNAPQALQFLGKEHLTPEGVALYQEPKAAVRRFEAGTQLTEAQIQKMLADAGYTEATTQELMGKIKEQNKFGGPLAAESYFNMLMKAGTRGLPAFTSEGVDLGKALQIPKDPTEALKEAVIPEVIKSIGKGDLQRAMELMQLTSPAGMAAFGKVEAEKVKPEKGVRPTKVEYPDPFFPTKKISGPPETVIPQVAERIAQRQVETEKNRVGSDVYKLKKKYPQLTDKQLITAIKAAEIKKMVEDLKTTKKTLKEGGEE